MKKSVLVAAVVFVVVALTPALAFAHHVGGAEDTMPADQWLYVDSVAHGASADGNMEVESAPGDGAGTENMDGETNWLVTGQANMNTP